MELRPRLLNIYVIDEQIYLREIMIRIGSSSRNEIAETLLRIVEVTRTIITLTLRRRDTWN